MPLFGTSSRATLASAILKVRASQISVDDVSIADNRRVAREVKLSSTSQASRRSNLGTDYVAAINVHICRSVVPEVGWRRLLPFRKRSLLFERVVAISQIGRCHLKRSMPLFLALNYTH